VILGTLGTLMVPTQDAWAACAPGTGSNITVTCSGATLNQGPGVLTGYGDSTQNGLTINVQSGASVTGTNTGIDVNNNNIINNFGTITTSGTDIYAISGNGSLTVNNSGSIGNANELVGVNSFGVGLTVNNNAGAVINGQTAIQGAGSLGRRYGDGGQFRAHQWSVYGDRWRQWFSRYHEQFHRHHYVRHRSCDQQQPLLRQSYEFRYDIGARCGGSGDQRGRHCDGYQSGFGNYHVRR